MADYHGPRQFAVYRNRDLCLETQEADVVLVSTILPIVYGKIYRKYKV